MTRRPTPPPADRGHPGRRGKHSHDPQPRRSAADVLAEHHRSERGDKRPARRDDEISTRAGARVSRQNAPRRAASPTPTPMPMPQRERRGQTSPSDQMRASPAHRNKRTASSDIDRNRTSLDNRSSRNSRRNVAPKAPPAERHRKPQGAEPLRRRAERASNPSRQFFHAGTPRRRLIALFVTTVMVFGLILARVGMLQTAEAGSYQSAGTNQRTREATLSASRGVIFDRNGDELALSVPATTIYVNPKYVLDPAGTAAALASALGLSPEKQQSLAAAMQDKTKSFVYVARQVDTTIADSVMALELNGVDSYTEDSRVVPGGDLAKSVIGRTDIDSIGTAGLEMQFNAILTGTDGERVSEIDTKGNVIPGSGTVSRSAVPGQDLVLTIDRSIQFSLEQALLKQVSSLPAKGGTGIVMEAGTGNILAMASVERDDEGVYRVTSANKGMTECNEPGSVAKVITAAGALNEGAVTPNDYFNVPWFRIFDENTKWQHVIRDAEPHPDWTLNMEGILVHSSNIGTMLLSDKIGPEKQWDYMTSFGFGIKSALDFPGETSGIFSDWHKWEGTEKLTPSYGYGVCVPAIQLVSAVNVIANGGVYVAPRLVGATIGTDGVAVDTEPSASHVAVTPTTAAEMNRMLQAVVCDGTAKGAQVDGITIAGKTGTAVKLNDKGLYPSEGEERQYHSSFVGFFPAEAPAVTTLISIDEPPAGTQDRFGGTAAAPVFKDIVPSIMHQQGVQPPTTTGGCPEK